VTRKRRTGKHRGGRHAAPRGARRRLARQQLGREFAKLWYANAISASGDGVALTAAPLLAASVTSDPRLVAGVTTALTIPYLIFSLPAGVIIDRVDRRRGMVAVDAFRAVLLGAFTALVLTHHAELPALYVCFFLIGTCETFFRNSSQALVPLLVEPRGLAVANGRMMGAEIVMNEFLGPMTGGFLFTAAVPLPFGVDALSFAGSSLLLSRVRMKARPAAAQAGQRAAQAPERSLARSLLADMAAGIKTLWHQRLLRVLALMAGMSNFVSYGILAVLVLFARHQLHLANSGYGLLLGFAAVGGVVASRTGPTVAKALGNDWTVCLAVAVQASAYLVISTTSLPVLTGAMLALAAAATVQWNIVVVVLRQTLIPNQVLGRVNSIYRLVAWGALPLGSLTAGFVAHGLGIRAVFSGAAIVLGAATLYLFRMALRRDIAAALATSKDNPTDDGVEVVHP
jgi:MFS family permease